MITKQIIEDALQLDRKPKYEMVWDNLEPGQQFWRADGELLEYVGKLTRSHIENKHFGETVYVLYSARTDRYKNTTRFVRDLLYTEDGHPESGYYLTEQSALRYQWQVQQGRANELAGLWAISKQCSTPRELGKTALDIPYHRILTLNGVEYSTAIGREVYRVDDSMNGVDSVKVRAVGEELLGHGDNYFEAWINWEHIHTETTIYKRGTPQ